MEKIIELKMTEVKNIEIFVNGKLKYTISNQDRNINASEIFEIVEIDENDKLIIKKDNEYEIDEDVLNCFYKLFEDIANGINEIATE